MVSAATCYDLPADCTSCDCAMEDAMEQCSSCDANASCSSSNLEITIGC